LQETLILQKNINSREPARLGPQKQAASAMDAPANRGERTDASLLRLQSRP
jgi:hypothetical protein